MSIRKEQCNKVCRILDDVLANRPTERDSLIIAVRKAFESLEQLGNSEQLPSAQTDSKELSFTHKALDTISRQAAIDALDEIEAEVADGYGYQYAKWREYFVEMPSAQPERKRGEWILAEDGWYCSVCELYPPFDCDPEEKGIPYCPYCGAKMDGELEGKSKK